MKVLITAPWVREAVDELRAEFPHIEFTVAAPADQATAIADAEVVFGPVTADGFAAAHKLRWLHYPAAGVEWMAGVPALVASDVTVTNARGAHATTIAEHTFGMLVFLTRNFAQFYEAQKQQHWMRQPWPVCNGLVGMTMGIIGLGQIGRAIAKRAHAFEMEIIAVDVNPVTKPDYVAELRPLDGLDDLLQRSDVVVVAVPITPETRGMLGPTQLGLLRSSAYLLVMSRGGIVDEPTVVQMLHEGKLAGAGFDVTAVEPLPPDNPLWHAPNVIITPHCSPSSAQTKSNVLALVRANLRRYLASEPLENLVNKQLGY
jgi:phosphoglycerate dehydrogenase-like enzyme